MVVALFLRNKAGKICGVRTLANKFKSLESMRRGAAYRSLANINY